MTKIDVTELLLQEVETVTIEIKSDKFEHNKDYSFTFSENDIIMAQMSSIKMKPGMKKEDIKINFQEMSSGVVEKLMGSKYKDFIKEPMIKNEQISKLATKIMEEYGKISTMIEDEEETKK